MNRRRKQTSNIGGTVGRKTSIDQLKKLSYQEALALLPSASSLPRDIAARTADETERDPTTASKDTEQVFKMTVTQAIWRTFYVASF